MKAFTILTYCSLVLSLFSCSTKTTVTAEEGSKAVVETVSCVAVLPTTISADESEGTLPQKSEILKAGALYIDSVLTKELKGNPKVRILKSSPSFVSGSDAALPEIAGSAGCDAAMITTLRRFQQRNGGEMAVDTPAAASFYMRIVKAKTGQVIWATDFSETQESLLSNILSFGKAQSRGFKWITVEELVTQGVREHLEKCPYF